MEFPILNSKEGLEFLENFLTEKSYISDYQLTQNDSVVFKALGKEPDEQYVNIVRWYRHVKCQNCKDLPSASVAVKLPIVDNEVVICKTKPFALLHPFLCLLRMISF